MAPSKSLLEEIKQAQSSAKIQCTIALMLDRLSDEDRKGLETAIADPTIHGTAIAKVLRARGMTVGDDSVRRHRRGVCACGVKADDGTA